MEKFKDGIKDLDFMLDEVDSHLIWLVSLNKEDMLCMESKPHLWLSSVLCMKHRH